MMRHLVLGLLTLFVIASGVYAAVYSAGIVNTGSYGSEYRFTWEQGCPEQQIDDPGGRFTASGAGPNQCAYATTGVKAMPWHCPLDSDGTTVFVENCNACDCPPLHRCNEPTGRCEACELEPCPPGMLDGRTIVGSPSDPCAYTGSCYHPEIDYTVLFQVDRIPLGGTQCRPPSSGSGTLTHVGDIQYHSDTYSNVFGIGCWHRVFVSQPSPGVLDCGTDDKWGTCACMDFLGCYSDTVYVLHECYNAGFSTPKAMGTYAVPRGGFYYSSYFNCQLGTASSSYRVYMERDMDGVVTCEIRDWSSTSYYKQARILECV